MASSTFSTSACKTKAAITPSVSRQWATAQPVDPDRLAESLAEFGGYCDCEVLANVEPEEI